MTDSSDVVPESGASLMRGYADVGGELIGCGTETNPRVCRDLAATAGGAATPFAAGASSRLRRGRAALPGLAGSVAEVFGSRGLPRLCRDSAAPAGVCAEGSGARSRPRPDRAALAGCKASGLGRQVDVDADVFSSFFQTCRSPIDRHRLVSDVVHGRCTSLALVGTNLCGVGHGKCLKIHVVEIHANSSGTHTYGNSRVERGHEGCGLKKPLSTSTRCQVTSCCSWSRVPRLWTSLAPGAPLVPGLVMGPLGKTPAPKASKSPPTARAAGFTSPAPGFKPPPPGSGVGFPPPGASVAPPRGPAFHLFAWPFPGASQFSLTNANDDPPYMTELLGAFTLTNSAPHFCRKGRCSSTAQKRKTSKFL